MSSRETAIAFLRRAVAYLATLRITVERLMTDNGIPTAQRPTRSPVASSASATCAPGPTRRAPTARPSASSRRSPRAGLTAESMAQAVSAPARCRPGSTVTTNESARTGELSRRWLVAQLSANDVGAYS